MRIFSFSDAMTLRVSHHLLVRHAWTFGAFGPPSGVALALQKGFGFKKLLPHFSKTTGYKHQLSPSNAAVAWC